MTKDLLLIYGGEPASHFNEFFLQTDIVDIIEFVHNPLYKQKSFLQQKYIADGLSLGQIAALTFSSKYLVREALKDNGIPLRTNTTTQRKAARPRFGFRIFRGKTIPMREDQNTIRLILKLRSENMSTTKIADVLMEMKIRTQKGLWKWHPEMVRRVLARANDEADAPSI